MRDWRIACQAAAFFALVGLTFNSSAQSGTGLTDGAAPQATKIRTFVTALGGTETYPLHAVHFNATSETLAVCASSDVRLCAQMPLRALDVLPHTNNLGEHRLLVVDSPFRYRSCVVGAPNGSVGLDCRQIGADELTGEKIPTASFMRVRLTDRPEYQCAYSFQKGLNCSSAQRFQPVAGSVAFGHFTGDPRVLQALSIEQGKSTICDIGGNCRAAEGLDSLKASASIATSERINAGVDRTHLLGVSSSAAGACVAFVESNERVGFQCEHGAIESTSESLEPFTTHGSARSTLDRVQFAPRYEQQLGRPRVRPTESEVLATRSRTKDISELAERAYRSAGGAMTPRRFKAALYVMELEKNRQSMLKVAKPGRTCCLDFSDESGPDNVSFWAEDGSWGTNNWSDQWGYEFVAWETSSIWSTLTRQECVWECDFEKAKRDDVCDLEAGDVARLGLAATFAGTMYSMWTGAGAVGVAVGGIVTTGGVAGTALLLCKSNTARERQRCYLRCPS